MNPQDRHPPDRSLHVQASTRRAGSSSPSDTRSNAASGLTQQGLANQRPEGERHDPSSEIQPGSSRDGHPAQQDLHSREAVDDSAAPPFRGRYADTETPQDRPMLDQKDPDAPRERS